jgi:CRP-like cAMP-binding protein
LGPRLLPGEPVILASMTALHISPPRPNPEQLGAVHLFASLTTAQLSTLSRLIDIESVPSGRTIVREGADGYAFHVLAEGAAQVRHGDTTVRTLGPNDYFGEVALIDNSRRTASVIATEPCVVWSMFGTTFRELAAEHPEIAAVLEQVAHNRRD